MRHTASPYRVSQAISTISDFFRCRRLPQCRGGEGGELGAEGVLLLGARRLELAALEVQAPQPRLLLGAALQQRLLRLLRRRRQQLRGRFRPVKSAIALCLAICKSPPDGGGTMPSDSTTRSSWSAYRSVGEGGHWPPWKVRLRRVWRCCSCCCGCCVACKPRTMSRHGPDGSHLSDCNEQLHSSCSSGIELAWCRNRCRYCWCCGHRGCGTRAGLHIVLRQQLQRRRLLASAQRLRSLQHRCTAMRLCKAERKRRLPFVPDAPAEASLHVICCMMTLPVMARTSTICLTKVLPPSRTSELLSAAANVATRSPTSRLLTPCSEGVTCVQCCQYSCPSANRP